MLLSEDTGMLVWLKEQAQETGQEDTGRCGCSQQSPGAVVCAKIKTDGPAASGLRALPDRSMLPVR